MSAPDPTAGVAAEELRQFVERIEAIEAEIKDRNSDKSEIFKELKGVGFDAAIVRKIVAERRDPEKAAEQNAILELYRSALSSRVHVHERPAPASATERPAHPFPPAKPVTHDHAPTPIDPKFTAAQPAVAQPNVTLTVTLDPDLPNFLTRKNWIDGRPPAGTA